MFSHFHSPLSLSLPPLPCCISAGTVCHWVDIKPCLLPLFCQLSALQQLPPASLLLVNDNAGLFSGEVEEEEEEGRKVDRLEYGGWCQALEWRRATNMSHTPLVPLQPVCVHVYLGCWRREHFLLSPSYLKTVRGREQIHVTTCFIVTSLT